VRKTVRYWGRTYRKMTNRQLCILISVNKYDRDYIRYGGTSKGDYTVLDKRYFIVRGGELFVASGLQEQGYSAAWI